MTSLPQVLTHRRTSHLEREEKGVLRFTCSHPAPDPESPFHARGIANRNHSRAIDVTVLIEPSNKRPALVRPENDKNVVIAFFGSDGELRCCTIPGIWLKVKSPEATAAAVVQRYLLPNRRCLVRQPRHRFRISRLGANICGFAAYLFGFSF